MNAKEIRAAILREWFALPPEQRATKSQAAQFADQVVQRRAMLEHSNSSAMINAWLVRYIGSTPFLA